MIKSALRSWGARLRDPKNQGNVMIGAGAVLVADGLVGLENPFDGRKSRVGIFGAVLLAVIGVVFTFVGIAIGHTTGPIAGGVTTTGRVVAMSTSTDSRGHRNSAPIIEFETPDGATHRFTDSVSGTFSPHTGDTVTVSYDPNNPSNARDLSNKGAKIGHWAFLGIGLLLVVLGSFLFVLRAVSIIGGLLLLRWGFERRRQAERGEPITAGPRIGSAMERVGTWMQARATKRCGGDPVALLAGDQAANAPVGSLAGVAREAAVPVGSGGPPADAAPPASPHASPPPGFYEDPHDATKKRWWDGSAWGDQVQ
jgi:hypothetical protein